jgi:glyoxylase-like metal-dependent hydrolase (beta-lactamase superfamily II)
VRVLALNPDVIVFISRVWQTTCTAVRSGEEGFLIDSPVYPDELEALPSVLEQAAFPVSGLLATHADWDHLLGRLAFGETSLGVGTATAERMRAEPGNAQRKLRAFDDQHYVERARPLALAGIQELPVPGRLSLGPEHELELHPAAGHTVDGTAFWMPWLGTLACGDYLSPVEIPMVTDAGAYAQTLERLRPLVAAADAIVPGHGAPLGRDQALAILDEDLAYVESLARDAGSAALPSGRRTAAQRTIHAENVARLGGNQPPA